MLRVSCSEPESPSFHHSPTVSYPSTSPTLSILPLHSQVLAFTSYWFSYLRKIHLLDSEQLSHHCVQTKTTHKVGSWQRPLLGWAGTLFLTQTVLCPESLLASPPCCSVLSTFSFSSFHILCLSPQPDWPLYSFLPQPVHMLLCLPTYTGSLLEICEWDIFLIFFLDSGVHMQVCYTGKPCVTGVWYIDCSITQVIIVPIGSFLILILFSYSTLKRTQCPLFPCVHMYSTLSSHL